MKRIRSIIVASKGFTLVEIIATIILMGILAAFFIHYMGTAVDYSWEAVELVQGEAEAESRIEQITAYFTSKINDDPDNALAVVVSEFSGQADMEYVEFNASGDLTAATGTSHTLRVTIAAPGNDLTTLLTQSRTDPSEPKVNY